MADDWERVDTGAPDPDLLARVRTITAGYEPLVSNTAGETLLNPELVQLHVADGITAASGRFDARWTNTGYYNYQATLKPSEREMYGVLGAMEVIVAITGRNQVTSRSIIRVGENV